MKTGLLSMPPSGSDPPRTAQREIVSPWTKAVYSTSSMSFWTYCTYSLGWAAHMENTQLCTKACNLCLQILRMKDNCGYSPIDYKGIAHRETPNRQHLCAKWATCMNHCSYAAFSSHIKFTCKQSQFCDLFIFFQTLQQSINYGHTPILCGVTLFIQCKSP